MPRPPVELPEALRTVPFRTADAYAAGLRRWHLEGSGVRRLYRGIYVAAGVPDSVALRGAGALLALPEGSALSHHTAAELRGLPVPSTPQIHAVVPGRAVARIGGIRVHPRKAVPEVCPVGGVRVTDAARTWVDLAAVLDRIDLVILGDATLHKGFATPDELAAAVERAGERHGVRAAREALPQLEPRTASPMETRLRMLLVDAGLPRPIANQAIYDADGGWLGEPDLQYPFARLVLEYEGDHHRTDKRQWRRDIRQDEVYRENHWLMLRFVDTDIFVRPEVTVERVRRALGRLDVAA